MADWTDIYQAEFEATVNRYEKQQDRLQKQEGFGSTDGGMALVRMHLEALVSTFDHHLDLARDARGIVAGLVPNLLQIDRRLLALCGLQTLLHTLGTGVAFGQQTQELGLALEAECFRQKLTHHDKKMAAEVERRTASVRGNTHVKRGVARVHASKSGYKVAEWSLECVTAAGGWLLDWVCSTLPQVFTIGGKNENKAVRLLPEALEVAQTTVDHCALRRPVYMPKPSCPAPWGRLVANADESGPLIGARGYILRTRHQDRLAAVKDAIRDGSMLPCLEGLNALQSVPWRINRRVLLVQQAAVYLGWDVGGTLPGKRLEASRGMKPWDDMTTDEKALWVSEFRAVRNHNDALIGERLTLEEDWAAAKMYRNQPFWIGQNMDWRGRVYSRCRFGFQREDRVRALFLFDRGEALGATGLEALLLHAANCWAGPLSSTDKRKTDKVPYKERVEWARTNTDKISACVRSPLTERWWTNADAPWSFLAACFEIASALSEPGGATAYVCRLPVAFDGSCSGIQHLSLLTKAREEAELVNLLPGSSPQDVYAAVAERACAQVAKDAERTDWPEGEAWKGEVARLALAYGVDRGMAKRNTMTWAYSSKRYGMGGQQQVDLMDKIKSKLLVENAERRDQGLPLKEHPFHPYHRGSQEHPGKAARYLGSVFFDAIETVMTLPGQAMLMLQGLAKVLAHEQKHVTWVSPSGLPCINRYNVTNTEALCLYTHIKGVRVRHQTLVYMGEEATVDKARCASGISPNFVHSHDAAHVHLVARACNAEGIQLATVHDSFACLPSRAARMNAILREQLVAMYQDTDLLREVWARASCALTATGGQRLPMAIKQGALDVREVLQAEYAFA